MYVFWFFFSFFSELLLASLIYIYTWMIFRLCAPSSRGAEAVRLLGRSAQHIFWFASIVCDAVSIHRDVYFLDPLSCSIYIKCPARQRIWPATKTADITLPVFVTLSPIKSHDKDFFSSSSPTFIFILFFSLSLQAPVFDLVLYPVRRRRRRRRFVFTRSV